MTRYIALAETVENQDYKNGEFRKPDSSYQGDISMVDRAFPANLTITDTSFSYLASTFTA